MPHTLAFQLHTQHKPSKGLPYFVHGVFHRLIEHDPVLSRAIHGDSTAGALPKPVALGWEDQGGVLNCRLRLLDEALVEPLLTSLRAQSGQGFGLEHQGQQLGGTVGKVEPLVTPSYSQLWTQGDESAAPNKILLKFVSPMAVSGGGQAWPLPIPRYIWNGLLWRWNHYSPLKFEEGVRGWWDQMLLCEEYQGRTQSQMASRREKGEAGFLGWGRYGFKKGAEADLRRQTATLAKFAEISGVGVNTAFGWGQIKAIIE